MAEVKLDTLELEIRDNAKEVSKNLTDLQRKIDGLGLKNGDRLKKLNDFLNEIKNNSADAETGAKLKSLASGLLALSNVKAFSITKSDATTFGELINAANNANGDFKNIRNLATALNGLGDLQTGKFTSATKALSILPNSLREITQFDGGADNNIKNTIDGLKTSLESLGAIGSDAKGFTNLVNKLKALPGVINNINESLKGETIDIFADRINKLHEILKPFAEDMEKISVGFSHFPDRIQKLITSTEKYNDTVKKSGMNLKQHYQQISMGIKSLTKAVTFAFVGLSGSKFFTESSDYVETLNLFNVTMREATDSAFAFAEQAQSLMGIDIKEWMNYQGEFQNLAKGYGIISEKATVMSQNLTQLAYDLSSVYNTSVETAFTKLQSAMSGQVKSLKVWGVDVSVASMKQYMLQKGMDASWNSLSVGTQALLRYNYILEKTTAMQGDLGRTLQTPANAVRILKAQITQLERAIGNILSLVVTKAMPYMQAFVELVKEAANDLATLWGYDPSSFVDWSSLDSTGFAEDMEDANQSAQELKRTLLGFDEINKLSDNKAGGGGMLNPEDLGINPDSYDFLANVSRTAVDNAKEQLSGFVDFIKGIVKTLGDFAQWTEKTFLPIFDDGFRIVSGFLIIFSAGQFLKGNPLMTGLGLLASGFTEAANAGKKLNKGLSGQNGLEGVLDALVGGGLAIAGGAIVGGPLGAFLGGLGALATALYAAGEENTKLTKQMLDTQVYQNNGTAIEELQKDIENYLESIGLGLDDQQEWIDKINASEKAYKDAAREYDNLWQQLSTKNEWSTEDIDLLSDSFNDLADSIKAVRDVRIDSVMQGISNAIKNNISPELNDMLDTLNSKIAQYQAYSDLEMGELRAEYNDILKNIRANGGIASTAQTTRLTEIRNELTAFSLSDVVEGWDIPLKNAKDNLVNAGENYDKVVENLNKFIGKRDEYLGTLEERYQKDLDSLKYMIQTDKTGIFDGTETQTLLEAWDAQVSKVNDEFNAVLESYIEYLKPFKSDLLKNIKMGWGYSTTDIGELVPYGGVLGSIIRGLDGSQAYLDKYNEIMRIIALVNGSTAHAAGGFPEDGLFFANSTELVGRFTNGRTAVANNEQIIEGIKKGVAEANRESGGGGNWTIQIIDPNGQITGETIITAAERRNRRDGKTVISIGAY